MNLDKIVCECFGVTNGQIREAVYEGATTLQVVADKTGAGTGCGACNDNLQRLVDFFATERDDGFGST